MHLVDNCGTPMVRVPCPHCGTVNDWTADELRRARDLGTSLCCDDDCATAYGEPATAEEIDRALALLI